MAYVPVPKDLNAVKTKVMFNLTKRQILCFGGGALIGVPLFFLLKGHIGSSAAALCMMLVMLPFRRPADSGEAAQHLAPSALVCDPIRRGRGAFVLRQRDPALRRPLPQGYGAVQNHHDKIVRPLRTNRGGSEGRNYSVRKEKRLWITTL